MIQSVTVKHHHDVVVQLVWQSGQMTTQTLNASYNVIPGVNDIVITHNKEQIIEPVEGRLIATCLFGTGGDIVSVILNSDNYTVIAINTDGFVKTYGLSDGNHEECEADVGRHRTRVEETWTRTNHP